MSMHTLLKDRASINILKILYTNETKNNSFTMTYSEMKHTLVLPETPFTLPNLKQAGLITIENGGETVLAITKKGKSFIDQFDKLIDAFNGKKKTPRAFKVKYDLDDIEEKILDKIEDIEKATIKTITKALFPRAKLETKKRIVTKHIKRLEELNLLKKIQQGREKIIELTESGARVIEEQLKNRNI